MALGRVREKVLFGLAAARGSWHRYTLWRWSIAVTCTLLAASSWAFDVLRFDLWNGQHRYLGRPIDLVSAAKHFAVPFVAINLAIVVASRFVGRYLCGFGCPYGALARWAEWLRFRARKWKRQWFADLALLAACALLCAAAFGFWVDWRVFRDGSAEAIATCAAVLVSAVATSFVLARRSGLEFCRSLCPSGVYFALLAHDTSNAVEFAHPSGCSDCGLCDRVCPMDLQPRKLSTGSCRESSGLYSQGTSDFAACIRCGDCVAACEDRNAALDLLVPLRMGFLRRSQPRTEGAAE